MEMLSFVKTVLNLLYVSFVINVSLNCIIFSDVIAYSDLSKQTQYREGRIMVIL